MSLSDEGQLERIVFDEAHTIVNWGNTFRPVYKDICEKLSALRCPKLLLSATVPAKLETEIKIIFDNLTVLRSSIFRDNLQLNVKERTKTFFDEMELLLKEHKNNCGIIYCVMPNDVANIHAELVKRGFECVKYHGQLSAEVRASSYSKWMSGEAKIIDSSPASCLPSLPSKFTVRFLRYMDLYPNGQLAIVFTVWVNASSR